MKLRKREFEEVDFTNKLDVENYCLTQEILHLQKELREAKNTIVGLCNTIQGIRQTTIVSGNVAAEGIETGNNINGGGEIAQKNVITDEGMYNSNRNFNND